MPESLRGRAPLIEKNFCVEEGCKSYCCHDMFFYMIENPKDYFLQPQKLPSIIVEESLDEGVYFAISGGQHKVIIVGTCPNLDNEKCKIYPNHPPGCKKIRLNSLQCQAARKRDKQ